MTTPQVLLVGTEAVDKHELLSRIVGRPLASNTTSTPWTLDNKYYTAKVVFQIAHMDGGGAADQIAASQQAVVLVFNATRRDSFTSLQQWWEQQGVDPAVKLAIATHSPGGGSEPVAQQQWLADAQEWCAEQLIEYIEVAPQQQERPPLQPQLEVQALGQEGDEAEGLQRVVEALHAHTWPGLRLKPRGTGHGDRTLKDSASDDASTLPQQQQGGAPLLAAGNKLETSPHTSQSVKQQEQQQQPAGTSLAVAEEQTEQLDLLFAELAGARDRLELLGDSERREAAAALMLRLMSALGVDEDGVDDEENSSEADSEQETSGPVASGAQVSS
ncbi:hypothetical protein N2152v2_005869 [Parachlorella kessleri]